MSDSNKEKATKVRKGARTAAIKHEPKDPRPRTAVEGTQAKTSGAVLYKGKDQKISTKHFAGSATGSTNTAAGYPTASNPFIAMQTADDTGHYDPLDLYALHILELLTSRVYTFSNLSRFEKNILYRYFYRYNPVIARVVDLHTNLPLSKIRLQAPRGVPEIVKDFVTTFYNRIMERTNFNEVLREMVLHHNIYGDAHTLVDDSYTGNRELAHPEILEENLYNRSEEDRAKLNDIEDRYSKDPESVSVQERREYLDAKFIGFYDVGYQGPNRISKIEFHRILEIMENPDLGYEAITIETEPALQELIAQGLTHDDLKELGYTEGFLRLLNQEDVPSDGSTITVDNDTLEGDAYLLRLRRTSGFSLIERVINECLEWYFAKKALQAKMDNFGKIGRIVTSEGLSEDQVALLRTEVERMLNDPGYAVVANFPITWEEVNSFIKDELDDLIDASENLVDTISMGTGIPQSLITGDSTYSGDNVKLDILNVEYLAFKNRVEALIEDRLLKPIALRKGLITIDEWGTPRLIYPKLTFSRMSLRSQDVFDILFSLFQKGSLPVSVIYDLLNLDVDDIDRGLKEDLFTLKDPNFNEMMRDLYTALPDDIAASTDLRKRLIETLGLKEASEELTNEF